MTVASINKPAKHGCYAHFPGSGPDEKCTDCIYFKHMAKKGIASADKGRCAKWAAMQNVSVMKAKPISRFTDACKHWEPAPPDKRPDWRQVRIDDGLNT